MVDLTEIRLLAKSKTKLSICGLTTYSAFLSVAFFYASCSAQSSQLAIIPQPTSVRVGESTVLLSDFDTIVCQEEGQQVATFLKEFLYSAGLETETVTDSVTDRHEIRLILSEDMASDSDEAYSVSVRKHHIIIEGSNSAGLFYGVQTLLQLLPAEVYDRRIGNTQWRIPFVEIQDEPRFEWRGLMVDLSRHFFPKDSLIEILDLMAMHKLNRLHLHLTDDPGWRIQIDAYPELTDIGAQGDMSSPQSGEQKFLTKQDLRELIAYAAERHIQIIPEIDMPGHAGAAARAYPEFFDGKHTFNPGNPDTFRFVETVLGEVIDLFPAPYVHFGGDEVRNHRWDNLPEVHSFMQRNKYKTMRQVEAHFDRFVVDLLIRKGRKPIGWDEIAGFGVDKEAVVQWWRGRQPEILAQAVKDGYRVIISPANHVYLDYANALGEPGAPWEGNDNGPNTLELIYVWEPVPDSFNEQEEALVLGVEACVWTEFIKSEEYLQFMVFPRLAALADVAWRPKGNHDLKAFLVHMEVQCRRYEALGVNYRIPGEYPVKYMRH